MPETRVNPPLGLVLAGGLSQRMGEDKGLIAYHREPQVVWLCRLLAEFCASVRVSIGPAQVGLGAYASLATIIDDEPGRGPAGGLISAWRAEPEAALLLVAVDLPLLDRATLAALTSGRSSAHIATAFRHPDGTLEPLCTLWEPAARTRLERRLQRGDGSLRRLLEASSVKVLEPPSAEALRSADSQKDRERVRRRLSGVSRR